MLRTFDWLGPRTLTQESLLTLTQSLQRSSTTFTSRISNKAKDSSLQTKFSTPIVALGPPLTLGPRTQLLSTPPLLKLWPSLAALALKLDTMVTFVVTVERLTKREYRKFEIPFLSFFLTAFWFLTDYDFFVFCLFLLLVLLTNI